MKNEIIIRDIFDTLLKTEYKNNEDIKELNEFYIDKFKYLMNILSNKNNFIVGRRGTGKTTLLYRAYLECIYSFSTNREIKYFTKNNNLGIYIDLNKITAFNDDSEDNFERDFLLDLVNELKEQVNFFWKGNLKTFVFNEKDAINRIFEEIKELIINGELINIDSKSIEKIKKDNIKAGINTSTTDLQLNVSSEDENSVRDITLLKQVDMNVNTFYKKLLDIKEKAKINNIFIFLDEYSSLNPTKQLKLAKLLKKLFDSGINIYYKIGVISDNYTFGELREDRDIHKISLDLDTIISNSGSIEKGLNYLSIFIEELISQRIKYFIKDESIENIFEKRDLQVILEELTKASMGVSRTLGRILSKALNRALNANSQNIKLSHVKEAIRENAKEYNEYFIGMIKKAALPSEYQNLLNDIIERAKKEQTTNKDKQASFFTWLPSKEFYLSKFEEHYLLHKIQHNHRLKDQKIDVDVYAIDYGLCLENKLNYYSSSKEKRQDRDYIQTRFFYDAIAIKYDSFFIKEDTFKCGKCSQGQVFSKSDLTLKSGIVLSNCPIHPEQVLTRIPAQNNNIHVYTEEEEKIIGLLSTISKEKAIVAKQIQSEVGVNPYKIAWFVKRIEKDLGILKRIKGNKDSLFSYYGELEDE